MKTKLKQSGISMIEITVVIAVVAALSVLTIPAINTLTESLGSAGTVKAMISAGLSSARAVAAKNQKYAGIRFQNDINGNQYMIFIIHDPEIRNVYKYGFKAIEGCKPIKLPENIHVMDGTYVTGHNMNNPVNPNEELRFNLLQTAAYNDSLISTGAQFTDMSTFSIVFSPAGKLVTQSIRVRNRDGATEADNPGSFDDIFNTFTKVSNNIGRFIQDDYFPEGLGPEPSRRSFIIYDKIEFDKANIDVRWSTYLYALETIYINPYIGTIISAGQ